MLFFFHELEQGHKKKNESRRLQDCGYKLTDERQDLLNTLLYLLKKGKYRSTLARGRKAYVVWQKLALR